MPIELDNLKPMFVLSAQTRERKLYYTGRTGERWVSCNFGEAFDFGGKGGAEHSRDLFNKRTPMTGLTFIVEEV